MLTAPALTDEALRYHKFLLLNASFSDHPGILNGKGSCILYYYALADYLGHPKVNETAFSFLDEVVSSINVRTPFTFRDGMAGIGVLLEFLSEDGKIEEDTNALLQEVETCILNTIYAAELHDISIASGVGGLGMYLMHRLHSLTPADGFHQLLQKEALIACVDQVDRGMQQPWAESFLQDRSIFTGLPGTLLFLDQVHQTGWYEPVTKQLTDQIITFLLDTLINVPFNWKNADAWYVLLQCTSSHEREHLQARVTAGYNKYLDTARLTSTGGLSLLHAAFAAMWFRLTETQFGMHNGILLSGHLQKEIQSVLESRSLGSLFPFNIQEKSIPLGLENGICGVVLPLLSMQSNNYNWLSIFGVNIVKNTSNAED